MKKKFFNGDTLFGLLILAISLLLFFYSYQYKGMAGEAGPGMFPRMAAVATGSMALILVITSIINSVRGTYAQKDNKEKADHRVFWYSLLLVTLYLIAWKYVHFIICTEIFLLAMSWVLKFSKKFAIIYSTVFSVGIYYIFANVFHILL